jgi:Rod binding domain-containing protein
MDIQIRPDILSGINNQSPESKQEKVTTSFEGIFARQLMEEMTKGLFKQDDNSMLGAGSEIYRAHIVDTLSRELAEQHKLGVADMITHYFNQNLNNHKDG